MLDMATLDLNFLGQACLGFTHNFHHFALTSPITTTNSLL